MIFRKKKKELPELWVKVDYSDKAKEMCVGGMLNLRIHWFNKDRMIKKEIYSDERIKMLKEMDIPIVYAPLTELPVECMKIPKKFILFGRVRIK